MEIYNASRSDIKIMLGRIVKKYLFSGGNTSNNFYVFYEQMIGKTRYAKLANEKELKKNTSNKYQIIDIYKFLSWNDKKIFVDLYFRYKKGLFFHSEIDYEIFKIFDKQMQISRNYVNIISKQFDIKEQFLLNFIKIVLGKKVISIAAKNELNNQKIFKEEILNKLNEGFVYTDNMKKYIVNPEGIAYKLIKKKCKLKKIKPILRENNKGSKYLIITMHSKQIHLHRLVALTFLPNPNEYKYVRAIDGNFLSVNQKNLEWVKYPAATRVIKNLSVNSDTWLSFVIENFEDGIEITPLAEILADIAEEKGIFPNNHNKFATVYATIEKYSQSNELFPIFNIYRGERNFVLINNKVYNEYKEKAEKNEVN